LFILLYHIISYHIILYYIYTIMFILYYISYHIISYYIYSFHSFHFGSKPSTHIQKHLNLRKRRFVCRITAYMFLPCYYMLLMFQEPPNASTSCCEHPCLEIWHLVNPNIKSLCYSSWNPWMLAGDPKFWKINHQAVLPSRMPPIFSHGRGDALWHRVSHLHWCRSSVVDQGGTTSRKSSVCQRTDQRNISETYWNRHQGIPRFKKSPYKSQRSYFLPMQSVVPREKLIIVQSSVSPWETQSKSASAEPPLCPMD